MEITGNITKQGQTVGVRIQDGDASYCIQQTSLTCRDIFDALIESGYIYASYPFGFVRDGKTIQDLEEISFETMDDPNFNFPHNNDYMSEAELKAALPDNHSHINLNPKAETLIKTRDEFLTFLLSSSGSTQIIDNPLSYLPLNYLVSDEALFTHSEYFLKRNEKYRELIERREKLSFECYRRLVDWMLEIQVISPDFSALDFKRAYYLWGVPGICTKINSIKEKDSPLRIMHSSIINNEKTVVNIHHFGCDGKLYPPITRGQKLTISEDWINEQSSVMEADELCLVTSLSLATNKVILMDCDGFTLEFDNNNRRICQKDPVSEYVNPILQIQASSGCALDTKYFNTIRRETQDAYWKDLVLSSCVEYLVQKTTVETDKSSFKALQEGLSLSPAAAIKYIIACLSLRVHHRVDFDYSAPIDANDEESGELINAYQAAYQFLPNMLSVQPEDFDINIFAETFGADPFQVADIIDCILSGDQNIDDIASGYIADRSISQTVIRQILDFAEARMGYSVDDIVETIMRFDPYSDDCLSFEKAGVGKLKTEIPVRNSQESAYAGEVMNYKALGASSALSWNCVLTAMAEPGRNEGRHCAAHMLSWTHRTSTNSLQSYQPQIEEGLKKLVLKSADNLSGTFERDIAIRCADIAVAHMLFDVRLNLKKEFTLPMLFGGMTVCIPDDVFDAILKSKNFHERLESTYGLSDHAVDGSDILFYFTNARITPHYIIPNRGMKIPEVPFLPMWWDITGRDDYMEKFSHLFPEKGFNGYSQKYYMMSTALPAQRYPMDEEPSLTSPYSLRVYYRALEAYAAEAIEKKTHHILMPPSLAELDQPYFYKRRAEVSCEEKDFYKKWIHSPPRMLTHDTKGMDEIGSHLLDEVKPVVSWLKGFTLTDYQFLSREVAYDIFAACGDRIKAVQYLGDSVRFFDGYIHNFRESDIDDVKYAVFKTKGGIYIPFVNGRIAKTENRTLEGMTA